MASYQDYARLLQLMLGQGGPNPYMGLGLRDRVREGWDNFAQRYLPQAPVIQRIMFEQLDETDPNTWKIFNRAGY